MKYYEIILAGFHGGTDDTDTLVVWISVEDRCPLIIGELTQHADNIIKEVSQITDELDGGIDYEFTEDMHDTDILTAFVADLYDRVLLANGLDADTLNRKDCVNRPNIALALRMEEQVMAFYESYNHIVAEFGGSTLCDFTHLIVAVAKGGYIDADYSEIGKMLSVLECYDDLEGYLRFESMPRPPKQVPTPEEQLAEQITTRDAIEMMRKRGGSFVKGLAEAWMAADLVNRSIIESSFNQLFLEYHSHATQEVLAGEYTPWEART